MKTMGRTTCYANYTEEQLLNGTPEQIESKVLDILSNSIDLHNINKSETIYLQNYLYGDQDIKEKVKLTRTEINNKGKLKYIKHIEIYNKSNPTNAGFLLHL